MKRAPWTPEEVSNLNAWQAASEVHPFTGVSGDALVATPEGWVLREGGPVVQDWAHSFMCDGSTLARMRSMLETVREEIREEKR